MTWASHKLPLIMDINQEIERLKINQLALTQIIITVSKDYEPNFKILFKDVIRSNQIMWKAIKELERRASINQNS